MVNKSKLVKSFNCQRKEYRSEKVKTCVDLGSGGGGGGGGHGCIG